MGVTGVVAGSAALGAGAKIWGSSQAAGAQDSAAQNAINQIMSLYGTTSTNLQPYISGGQGAFNQLQTLTGTNRGGNPMTAALTAPFQPTMTQLEQTPGYQFTQNQGLKATQNAMVAGGQVGGNSVAGAGQFATGLASQTYQQQFQNYLSQNQQIYNMLNSQAQTGLSAAGTLGNIGLQTGAQTATENNIMGSANANMYNSIGNSLSSLAGTIGNTQVNAQMLGTMYPQLQSLGPGFTQGFLNPSSNNFLNMTGTQTPSNNGSPMSMATLWNGNTMQGGAQY